MFEACICLSNNSIKATIIQMIHYIITWDGLALKYKAHTLYKPTIVNSFPFTRIQENIR